MASAGSRWPTATPPRAPPRHGPTGTCCRAPRDSSRSMTESDCDMVLNAIVGSAGLLATVATLGEGIDLALANKESLVVGGELVNQLAEATGAQITAGRLRALRLHQLIAGERAGARSIASADRLRRTVPRPHALANWRTSRVEQALAHPTWSMGGKITIDSATLMNKGLEVIEAHHLFGTPYDQIDVVVHPQSIVHSLIQLCDGATLAHLGYPDMRVPISYALHYPTAPSPGAAARPGRGRRADLRAARHRDVRLPAAWRARPAAPAGPRRARSTPPTRWPCTRSCPAGCVPGHRAVIEETLAALRHGGAFVRLADGRRSRGRSVELSRRRRFDRASRLVRLGCRCPTSWRFWASCADRLARGWSLRAAKAVGMRVERFSLFFGPMLVEVAASARPSTGSGRYRSAAT